MSDKGYQRLQSQSSSSENEGRTPKEVQILSPATLADLANKENFTKPPDAAVPGVGSGDIVLFSPVDLRSTPSSTDLTGTMKSQPDGDDNLVEVDLTREDEDKKKKSLLIRLTGILSILISTMCFALTNQILYYLFDKRDATYGKSLFFLWSYTFYTVFNYIPLQYALYKNSQEVAQPFKDDKKFWWLLLIRGLFGSVIPFSTSHAIDRFHMPAPVSVITAMGPIIVYFNAYFILHEPLGLVPILNAFLAIGGVFIMNLKDLINHRADSKILEGTGIALIAMVLLSWVAIIVRILRRVDPFIINLSFGLGGMLVQGAIAFINKEFWLYDNNALGLCVAVAILWTTGNYLLNISLKYESAGIVSLIKTTEVLFSFLFQFFIFEIQPDMFMAIGGAMILFGVGCVTLRKIVAESSESCSLRKYCWFLLY